MSNNEVTRDQFIKDMSEANPQHDKETMEHLGKLYDARLIELDVQVLTTLDCFWVVENDNMAIRQRMGVGK